MSTPSDASLSSCGCCEGAPERPALYNPPGLAALVYRIATQPQMLQRLRAGLYNWEVPDGEHQGSRPLAALTTRAPNDFALALLDASAVMGDVLTFYQERIANEGFLRTATERRSVLELARAIGYELAPGVAASTHLAFTVDDSPGAKGEAQIPLGAQVQSLPAQQDELPQTFETGQDFTGLAQWNQLEPRTTLAQGLDFAETTVYLKGINTQLQPGDALLFVGEDRERFLGSERWDVRVVQTVTAVPDRSDAQKSYTVVTWEPGLGHEAPRVLPEDNPRVFVFRQRGHLFGYNAPDFRMMPLEVKQTFESPTGRQWPSFNDEPAENARERRVYLDQAYPKVLPQSWVALVKSTYTELYRVLAAVPDDRVDYGLTAQVTRLDVDTSEHLSWFGLRETLALIQSEELALAGMPDLSPIEGNTIELDTLVSGLEEGHALIVSGPLDGGDEAAAEVAFVSHTLDQNGRTTLVLEKALEHRYVRAQTVVYANVVPATHGESVQAEVLGSGDGAQIHQRFKLKRPPLTYVSAASASGTESTLEVRVEGLEWEQVPSLYGVKPGSRSYIVRHDDAANAFVLFGDGKQGARLPTGQENVKATYRSGLGLAGEVAAGAITLLKKRPFGVKAVVNPVPATGAEDPETLAEARTNAPLTVLTLERIVSVQDFEDYARAFAGIGKAQAVVVWSGETPRIHVTVASASGEVVASGSDLHANLLASMNAARDPLHEVELGAFEPLRFNLAAKARTDPAYLWADVDAELRIRLLEAFGFERRGFGQPVSAAEVVSVLQAAPGVVAVDLDTLYLDGAAAVPAALLPARAARYDPATHAIAIAQLLLINPAGIVLEGY